MSYADIDDVLKLDIKFKAYIRLPMDLLSSQKCMHCLSFDSREVFTFRQKPHQSTQQKPVFKDHKYANEPILSWREIKPYEKCIMKEKLDGGGCIKKRSKSGQRRENMNCENTFAIREGERWDSVCAKTQVGRVEVLE